MIGVYMNLCNFIVINDQHTIAFCLMAAINWAALRSLSLFIKNSVQYLNFYIRSICFSAFNSLRCNLFIIRFAALRRLAAFQKRYRAAEKYYNAKSSGVDYANLF